MSDYSSLDKQNLDKLSRNFSGAALTYDEYAIIQKEVSDILFGMLPDTPPHKILDIGCGTGKNSLEIAKKYPQSEMTLCDIAPMMLEKAKKDMPHSTNFLCGDAQTLEFPEKYDLIFSNMSFQWFDDIPYSMKRLMNYVNDGGYLIGSVLMGNSFFEWYDALLQVDETFIPPVKKYIDWRGFNFSIFSNIQKIEKFSSSKDFFKMLKSVGAYTHQSNDSVGVAQLKKAAQIFSEKYQNQITYDICLFVIRK